MSEIENILTKVKSGMAKTNLFIVNIPFLDLGTLLEFRAKGAQLPSSELASLEIPHRGRRIKVPGQRSFTDWTITVMETKEMKVRILLEKWMELLNGASSNSIDTSITKSVTVRPIYFDSNNGISQGANSPFIMTLEGAFPTNISAIEFSFDEQTAPLEYQVTFSYAYHTMTSSNDSGI